MATVAATYLRLNGVRMLATRDYSLASLVRLDRLRTKQTLLQW